VPTDQQQADGFALPRRQENTDASDNRDTSKMLDAPDPIALLAENTVEQTGFDLRTGEIVNPARFQKWKEEHSASSSAGEYQTNASVMEAFRKARIVIEAWIDQENNRALILRGNIQEIVSLPEVFALFQEYAQWGPVFLSKLARHFVFLVENRRKFYDSRAAQPSVVSPEEVTKPRQGKAWIFWSLIFFGLALHLAAVAAWIIWSNSKP
jgi:hypothetical protein